MAVIAWLSSQALHDLFTTSVTEAEVLYGVERLPNGHVLLACPQRIVEIDRNGNLVWEAKHSGHVRRAHRR